MIKTNIQYLQRALEVEADGIIGPITRKAYADKILPIALNELGIHEIGNSNSSPRVKEYQATTDLGGTGWPWCSAFLCWVFKQSKIFTEENRPKSASAFGFEDWGKEIGLIVLKNPYSIKRGDIVVYKFSHISLAVEASDYDGDFKSIEGNTNTAGSRDGGSVLTKTRNIASVRSVIRL